MGAGKVTSLPLFSLGRSGCEGGGGGEGKAFSCPISQCPNCPKNSGDILGTFWVGIYGSFPVFMGKRRLAKKSVKTLRKTNVFRGFDW